MRRTGVTVAQAEALATAGAFECFGLSRRAALWGAGAAAAAGAGAVIDLGAAEEAIPAGETAEGGTAGAGAGAVVDPGAAEGPEPAPARAAGPGPQPGSPSGDGDPERLWSLDRHIGGTTDHNRPKTLPAARPAHPPPAHLPPADPSTPSTGKVQPARLAGLITGADAPPLPAMDAVEINQADLWATGLSPDRYPTEFVRAELTPPGWSLPSGWSRCQTGHG